jgi:hypothetical protein
MKTKNKIKKTAKSFDTVKTFREIKEKIAKDISGMNATEMRKYLKKRKLSPSK